MARGDLTCPLCSQVLGLPSAGPRAGTDVQRDGAVGGHIHIAFTLPNVVCSNNHRWSLAGDVILTRIS
jgi:hypothetical protein